MWRRFVPVFPQDKYLEWEEVPVPVDRSFGDSGGDRRVTEKKRRALQILEKAEKCPVCLNRTPDFDHSLVLSRSLHYTLACQDKVWR